MIFRKPFVRYILIDVVPDGFENRNIFFRRHENIFCMRFTSIEQKKTPV